MRRLSIALIILAMAVIAYDGATHPNRLYISLLLMLLGLVALVKKGRLSFDSARSPDPTRRVLPGAGRNSRLAQLAKGLDSWLTQSSCTTKSSSRPRTLANAPNQR